jgi:hypothetical protein
MTGTGPSWLAGTFAVIMLATSAYCVSRLVAARRLRRHTERDIDVVHVLMGVAMAGMLVPRLNPFWDGGWVAIFAGWTAWFGWQAIRASRRTAAGHSSAYHLPHLLACGAMLYMLLAVTSARAAGPANGASMAGAPGAAARFPTLALVLALAILGNVVWTTDRLTSLAPVAAAYPRAARLGRQSGSEAAQAGSEAAQAGVQTAQAGARTARCLRQGFRSAAGPDAANLRRDCGPPISPRLAASCEIAIGVTMGYMLILML